MHRLLSLLALLTLVTAAAKADDSPRKILVADPFIELHTGPGRGYPVFHVIERGREVTILKRRTDWFQIRTDRDVEGWVAREQMGRRARKVAEAEFSEELVNRAYFDALAPIAGIAHAQG